MKKNGYERAGVTLLELIVTLAILGILLLRAIPAYGDFVVKHKITTASSDLHGAILYARSEAIKRGGNVIICRSSSTMSENPACDIGVDTVGTGWAVGWLVFHDRDQNHRFSTGDEILAMHGRLFQSAQEGRILTKPTRHQLEFNATGQVFATYMSFAIDSPNQSDPDHNRYICIASGGRARVSAIPCS